MCLRSAQILAHARCIRHYRSCISHPRHTGAQRSATYYKIFVSMCPSIYMCTTRNSTSGLSGKHSPKIAHLSQTIHLSGLGCPAFESVTDTLLDIHGLFSCQFPEGTLQSPVLSFFMQHLKLEASTQYFTTRKSSPNGESISFSEDIDPQGNLAAYMGSDLYHGFDNHVQYFTVNHNNCESKE